MVNVSSLNSHLIMIPFHQHLEGTTFLINTYKEYGVQSIRREYSYNDMDETKALCCLIVRFEPGVNDSCTCTHV